MNIIENYNLHHGTKHWIGQGGARLYISSGAPTFVPPAAALSLPSPPRLSGNYLIASNRTQFWEGPAQTITDKLELFVVYQVSAWVRVGNCQGKAGQQKVNVALGIDGNWVTGGEVEADEYSWKEIMGSFRLETKPGNVLVYAQGPEAGVDILLAGEYILRFCSCFLFRLNFSVSNFSKLWVGLWIWWQGCKFLLLIEVHEFHS